MTYESSVDRERAENLTEQGDNKKVKAPLDKSERAIWESVIIFSGFLYTPLWGIISLLVGIISWLINLKRDKKIAKSFLRTGVITLLVWIIVTSALYYFFLQPKEEELNYIYQMHLLITLANSVAMKIDMDEDNGNYENINCKHEDIKPVCQNIERLAGVEPTLYFAQNRDSCAYVKMSEEKYFCIYSTGRGVMGTSIEYGTTSSFPGQAGYCNGETFKCPSLRN